MKKNYQNTCTNLIVDEEKDVGKKALLKIRSSEDKRKQNTEGCWKRKKERSLSWSTRPNKKGS